MSESVNDMLTTVAFCPSEKPLSITICATICCYYISGDAGSNPAAPITYWVYSLIGRIPDGKLPVQLIAVNI